MRTSVQRSVGGYSAARLHTSDLNMWLRIAAVSDVAYVKGADQALYRVHSEGMHRTMMSSESGPMIDLRERRAAFEDFFVEAGTALPEH